MRRAVGILVGLGVFFLLLSLWPASRAPVTFWHRGAPPVLVIAHGTGQGLGPQNTLEAALLSAEAGADVIELDVHLSVDGHLVVIHDPTIDATTNGTGAVKEMRLKEIQAFNAGVAFSVATGATPFAGGGVVVPTLRAIFEALPVARFLIEIKPEAPGTDQALCTLLREYGLGDQTMVGSFHVAAIKRFRKACPEVATSLAEAEVMTLVYLHKIGFANLAPLRGAAVQVPLKAAGVKIITRSFIDMAHARGLDVHAWTINDPDEMQRLVAMGIDGLVTDYPRRTLSVLGRE
jgi:glycerophosphoryl diester phosphodiesterase